MFDGFSHDNIVKIKSPCQAWGYLHLQGPKKIVFFLIRLNRIQTFNLTSPYKNFPEIVKGTQVIQKNLFKIKVNKSGRCHNLRPKRITWGNFPGNRACWGSIVHVIFILCLHRVFYKIHTWKLFVYGKIFARGKIKSGRKNRSKKERKSTNLLRKGKIALWKRLYWRSSTLASRFPTKFDRHDVKRGFLFFMQVTALLQKRKQAPRILMNELQGIGSLRLRKEFWDRQRKNIVTR